MSLAEPTIWERVITNKRWIIYAVLALVLVAAGLFIWQSVNTYIFNRGVKKDKAAISNQLKEIANTEAQIANLKDKKAEQAANVARDTQALLDSANASQAAREDTNRALSNLNAAVNANRPVDVTANDLEKRLKELDN